MNQSKKLILGGGESGTGAALLAQKQGFEVFLSDGSLIQDKYKKILQDNAIPFEDQTHEKAQALIENNQKDILEIIKSPGIPDSISIISNAKQKEISIISEVEFAFRYTKAKIIAITGSNGKTTTTLLTYHLLKNAGLNVGMAGNVGDSFAKMVIEEKVDYWVLEVSSFQLDNCYNFKPYIAILLNITPDHLDRYDNKFENYVDAKFRIVQSQNENDYFIFYKNNVAIQEEISRREMMFYEDGSTESSFNEHYRNNQIKSIFLPIKTKEPAKIIEDKDYKLGRITGGFATIPTYKDFITFVVQAMHLDIKLDEISLKGKHNLVNTCAAVLSCIILKVSAEKIKEGLKTFKNVAHRLEEVAQINEVTYINDSKATNVDAVWYALDAFNSPTANIIWIAGGLDKGNNYAQIEELVSKRVKSIICLGMDNEKIMGFFKTKVKDIYQSQSVEEVVKIAQSIAKPGDVVMLSPACASFDLFKNYEDRGNKFKKAVEALAVNA